MQVSKALCPSRRSCDPSLKNCILLIYNRRQFAQQRLKKGAVIGGWVSSFYLLLPVGLTPFLGVFIDVFGHRVSFRELAS